MSAGADRGLERVSAPQRSAAVCLVGLIAGGHSGVPRYAVALSQALDRVVDGYPDLSLSLLTTVAGAAAIDARSIDVRVVAASGRAWNSGPGRLAREHVPPRAERPAPAHFFHVRGPQPAPRKPFEA